MQTTSAIWDALWASGTATLDAVAVIGSVEYTDISAPIITRGTMQGQLSVGNVVSACCAVSVRAASSAIPRSAVVHIKHRLVSADGATVSEWLPAGTFYISRRRVDPINGVVILECYDALLKSNEDMPELPGVTYPISMTVAAQTIAQIIGVDIDSRTVIQTGAEYVIGAPTAGTTMRDILATIAGANAGNWIMTPSGKLRLVPVVDVTGAASPLAVSGVIGGIQIGDAGTVTGVRREDEGGNQILIGTDGGIIVDVGLSAPLALAASEILIGQVYQPYAMTGAVYSPAAEIGDPVDADGTGTVIGVLYNETASLGPAYRGDISAPGATEYSNEYPFIGGNAKTLTLARAYAREVTQALDDSLDQEEVFNRLTDNGLIQGLYMLNGQLYVNANYIRSGEIDADVVKIINLSASDIDTGLIHSADYETVVIPKVYPATTLYPAADVFPNYGERVIRGFAIDFATGQIYGAFYSEQIEDLQDAQDEMSGDIGDLQTTVSGIETNVSQLQTAVSSLQTTVSNMQDAITALQNALVYPKALPTRMAMFPARNVEEMEEATDNADEDATEGEEREATDGVNTDGTDEPKEER